MSKKLDRLFHSQHNSLTAHIFVKDERGKPKMVKDERDKEIPLSKPCHFQLGKYYAQTSEDSEIHVDEYELLKNHPEYGVSIFTTKDWANRVKESLDNSDRQAIEHEIGQKDKEIERLKRMLEDQKLPIDRRQGDIKLKNESTDESEYQFEDHPPIPVDNNRPKKKSTGKKRGRPKKVK